MGLIFRLIIAICFFLPFYSSGLIKRNRPVDSVCVLSRFIVQNREYLQENDFLYRLANITKPIFEISHNFCLEYDFEREDLSSEATLFWNSLKLRTFGDDMQINLGIEYIGWILIVLGTMTTSSSLLGLGLLLFSISIQFNKLPCDWSGVEFGFYLALGSCILQKLS